jgi:hypothetical protein
MLEVKELRVSLEAAKFVMKYTVSFIPLRLHPPRRLDNLLSQIPQDLCPLEAIILLLYFKSFEG